jgi:hypothetical protein
LCYTGHETSYESIFRILQASGESGMDKCANFPELIIQIFKIDFQNVTNLEARLAYYEVSFMI